MSSEGVYIRKFQTLHRDSIPGRWTDITLGKAPHKPLLLLCVIDLYRDGLERANRIEPTLYLEEAFNAYWNLLFSTDTSSTFALPFFHLQHDGFWSLVAANGTAVTDPSIAKAACSLRSAVAFAKLDEPLHELLRRSEWNQHLRSVILTSNFQPETHGRFVRV